MVSEFFKLNFNSMIIYFLLLIEKIYLGIVSDTALTNKRAEHFKMNLDYKDILPISGTVLKRGTFTLNGCGSVCISDEFCQTIFYQPLAGNCFLYNYSIGEHTPIKSENGTEIYEIYCKSCMKIVFYIFYLHAQSSFFAISFLCLSLL